MYPPVIFYRELESIAREAYEKDRKEALRAGVSIIILFVLGLAASILLLVW